MVGCSPLHVHAHLAIRFAPFYTCIFVLLLVVVLCHIHSCISFSCGVIAYAFLRSLSYGNEEGSRTVAKMLAFKKKSGFG